MVISVFSACGALLELLVAAPEGSSPSILIRKLLLFSFLGIFSAGFTFWLFSTSRVFGGDWRSFRHWKGWLLLVLLLLPVVLWASVLMITVHFLQDAIMTAIQVLNAVPIPES